MKSKKNLAATLAFLMTLQATGQPWAVLANGGEDNDPILGEATDDQTADELSDDVAIEEPVQETVTTAPDVQASAEVPAVQETAPAPEVTVPAEEEEMIPPFADMSEEGSYTAKVDLINTDETVNPVIVDLGVIKEKAPNMEAQNYVYKKAAVNGETVTAVRKWVSKKEGEKTFCLLENGDVLELTPGWTLYLRMNM